MSHSRTNRCRVSRIFLRLRLVSESGAGRREEVGAEITLLSLSVKSLFLHSVPKNRGINKKITITA